MAWRSFRVGRTCIVAAVVLVAIAQACTTFESDNSTADAGDDGGVDGGSSPSQESSTPPVDGSSSDAPPSCPTLGCPTTLDAGASCDDFNRESPYVGWGQYGEVTEIADGGCSGGVLAAALPAVFPDAAAPAITKMLSTTKSTLLKTAIAEFDIWVDYDITAFDPFGFTRIFSLGKDGAPDAGGRFAGINIDKDNSVVAVVRNTGVNINRPIPLPPRQWAHVRFVVHFGKSTNGKLAVSIDGNSIFDETVATLAVDANDEPGFSVNVGVQSIPTTSRIDVKIDNFLLITTTN